MKSPQRKRLSQVAGYSLVEMMMTLAIGLVLASVAMPMMVGAIQGFRLNSAAQQVANLIDLTRYTAIRRNAVMSLQKTTVNGNSVFYIDLNGNNVLDANEPMVMLPADMQLANGQTLTPPKPPSTQDFTSLLTFDYRGTVNFSGGGPIGAYFLAIGYTTQAQYGCRAITVTPMGQTKLWKAGAGGIWTGM